MPSTSKQKRQSGYALHTEVRESKIPGAGLGLFTLEKVRPRERVAIYEGKLLTKEQMLASKSKYIVQVNDKQYLDGADTKYAVGRYANYATYKHTNANLAAGTKPNWNAKKKVWWISIIAKKNIKPNVEIKIPYGKRYKHARKRSTASKQKATPAPAMRQVRAPIRKSTPTHQQTDGNVKSWKRACARARDQINRLSQQLRQSANKLKQAIVTSATRLAAWYSEIDNREGEGDSSVRYNQECQEGEDENAESRQVNLTSAKPLATNGAKRLEPGIQTPYQQQELVVDNGRYRDLTKDDNVSGNADSTSTNGTFEVVVNDERGILVVENGCSHEGGDSTGEVTTDEREVLVVENGCSHEGGESSGEVTTDEREVLVVANECPPRGGEGIRGIKTADRRVLMVEKLRAAMRGKGKHATNKSTCKVRHGSEGPRVTWADESGGNLHARTFSDRLRYGGGRKREANAGKRVNARWPSPTCEPRRNDELRRGLYEREDDEWHLDKHVMCDDIMPTET